MWASLPENEHNPAPLNPPVYESDLPTFTSDVRMEKIPEIFATGPGKGERSQAQGSGGGGPVEAVWWVKEVGVQWRVKGTAFVVANDIDQEGHEESSGVRTVKSEVGSRMRVKEGMGGKEGEWSWGKEVTGHFGNCSPGMRGEFCISVLPLESS
jgi:pyridoxamine 5'-phosphate oxidase